MGCAFIFFKNVFSRCFHQNNIELRKQDQSVTGAFGVKDRAQGSNYDITLLTKEFEPATLQSVLTS